MRACPFPYLLQKTGWILPGAKNSFVIFACRSETLPEQTQEIYKVSLYFKINLCFPTGAEWMLPAWHVQNHTGCGGFMEPLYSEHKGYQGGFQLHRIQSRSVLFLKGF